MLKLYLVAIRTAVGALLAQDNPAEEKAPIYYVSRQLKMERLCLALVYRSQRLRHYFLAHKLHLMVKFDPAIKGQVVINMLALFLEEEEAIISKEVLDALPEIVVATMKDELWVMYFDGSFTTT
ncbi:hypothetical protein D8674_026505 [Pyrus ussuriensis x Pyrus communis]|uniref:Reverse transcriptase RNase H-like domain-containing protein n=1 Tax=Pyrus ussuriensis x Pyrus communis TaxID=2448454 RepID=A0A5N5IBJ7_9ROSA|nr:hypothetical protein D8674_026505 [Pyrus ussuriensis x Pyrus communis]